MDSTNSLYIPALNFHVDHDLFTSPSHEHCAIASRKSAQLPNSKLRLRHGGGTDRSSNMDDFYAHGSTADYRCCTSSGSCCDETAGWWRDANEMQRRTQKLGCIAPWIFKLRLLIFVRAAHVAQENIVSQKDLRIWFYRHLPFLCDNTNQI